MKNRLALLIAIIVGVVLLAYMFVYQVRFDEVAIQTTFEKMDKESVEADPGGKFRWPWPVQRIHKFSTHIQLLEDELRDLQTKDKQVLTLRTYLMWRIEDPGSFYVNLQKENASEARSRLKDLLGESVKNVFTQYEFDQLVNEDTSKIKLEEIEQKSLEKMRQLVEQSNYGVTLEQVGIKKLVLPQNSTTKVFERMKAVRDRLAAEYTQSGAAQAQAIQEKAKKASSNIRTFAMNRAADIRTKGDKEANRYAKVFQQDESLGSFLRQMETYKRAPWDHTVVILKAEDITGAIGIGVAPNARPESNEEKSEDKSNGSDGE